MLSIDTNVLFHATQPDSPSHALAYAWVAAQAERHDIVLSELMLAELYRLLRNPVVQTKPLTAPEAASVIDDYRRHPYWRTIGFPYPDRPCHNAIWHKAAEPDFAYRRFYDARMAISLRQQGVDEFATANVDDFRDFGFVRLWNPLRPSEPS